MNTENRAFKIILISCICVMQFAMLSCFSGVRQEEEGKIDAQLFKKNEQALMHLLADSLHLDRSQYSDLMMDWGTDYRTAIFLRKLHLMQDDFDSLQSSVNETEALSIDLQSTEVQELRTLVNSMHKAWRALPLKKDKKALIDFFDDRYTISRVAVSKENQSEFEQFTQDDFPKYLDEIISRNRSSIQFGNVKFLDAEFKDNQYFNLAYKCTMRSYNTDQLVFTQSLLVNITGKKKDGDWKVANYSWVSFGH